MRAGGKEVKDALRKTADYFAQNPLVDLAKGAYSTINGYRHAASAWNKVLLSEIFGFESLWV